MGPGKEGQDLGDCGRMFWSIVINLIHTQSTKQHKLCLPSWAGVHMLDLIVSNDTVVGKYEFKA
jgi:hypothetical protein